MDSDADSYYEENSEAEEGLAEPLNIRVNVKLEKSPESPPPQPESPSPVAPAPIPVGNLSPSGNCQTTEQLFYNTIIALIFWS